MLFGAQRKILPIPGGRLTTPHLIQPVKIAPIKKKPPPQKQVRKATRSAKPLVSRVKAPPIKKKPISKKIKFSPKKLREKKPVATPFEVPAIEKERREVIRAVGQKRILIKKNQQAFRTTFQPSLAKQIGKVKVRKIDMRVPLGQIVSTPPARLVTRKMGLEGTFLSKPPKKMKAKVIFRKSSKDIVKDVEREAVEKPVITPATKNFLQALLPGLALFFLKK